MEEGWGGGGRWEGREVKLGVRGKGRGFRYELEREGKEGIGGDSVSGGKEREG